MNWLNLDYHRSAVSLNSVKVGSGSLEKELSPIPHLFKLIISKLLTFPLAFTSFNFIPLFLYTAGVDISILRDIFYKCLPVTSIISISYPRVLYKLMIVLLNIYSNIVGAISEMTLPSK